jgi:O-antigen ligase
MGRAFGPRGVREAIVSTLAVSPGELHAAPKRSREIAPADASVFPLVVTYALVAVLLFLAARGAFSFLFPVSSNGVAAEGNVAAKNAMVVAAFAIMLAVMLPVCKAVWRTLVQYPILVALPVWATISTAWSQYPVRSLAAGVQVMVLTLFGIYIPVRFTPRQQMQLFVFAGVMTAVLSWATAALYPSAGIDYKNVTIGVEGIFPQKNICAVVTIELLTAGLCYRFRGRNAAAKRFGFVFLLLTLIVATMARTGWILLILVAGFIALLKGLHRLRPLERFVVTWFLPALSAAGAWLVFVYRFDLLHLIGKGATLSGRTDIWQAVFLSIVKRPWTGFGYAAFWVAGAPEATRLAQLLGDKTLGNAENGVLQLWLEVGLVGVLIMFVLLIRSTRNAIACFRSNTPNYAIWYKTIIFINLLALVDGDKFLLWTSLEWAMFIMADVGLANEARRLKAIRPA